MIHHSERLSFEKFQEEDFSLYFQLASNEQVMHYISGKATSEVDAKKRYQTIVDHNSTHKDLGFFKVNLQSDHAFIGLGKLEFTQEGEAELGYSMLPTFWGKGYGSEISAWLVQYALTIPTLQQLMAIIDPKNTASKKILTKQNFTFTEKEMINYPLAAIYHLKLK